MSRRRVIVAIGLLALGAAISVLWIWFTGGVESIVGLRNVAFIYWLPLLCATAAHLTIRFVRWQFLLRRAEVRLPTRRSFVSFLASLVGAATPAYLGEAVRCVFIKKNHGAPARLTLTILIMERLFDIIAIAVVGIVCSATMLQASLLLLIIIIAGLFIFGLLRIARFSALPIPPALWIPSFRTLAPAFFLSLAAWGLAALSPSIAARALGENISFIDGGRIFSHSTLLGGATLMPAGLGATGSAAVFQMQTLGFSPARALPIVALFRFTTTGFALAVGAIFLMIELKSWRRGGAATAAEHFDEIASDYEKQYAPHVWKLLLERKVNFIIEGLASLPKDTARGLDFGCGLGRQLLTMREKGWRVSGVDPSTRLLMKAGERGAPVVAGDGLSLPFKDATFDFVYTIGVLHHLPSAAAQDAAVAEIRRVLKPGGLLFIQETNTRNPLFVFYMGYVFPIVKTIDEGVEHWVAPGRFDGAAGWRARETRYFTFLPDTIPRPLLTMFLAIERRLERSSLRPYAVHYMAVLQKDDAAPNATINPAAAA